MNAVRTFVTAVLAVTTLAGVASAQVESDPLVIDSITAVVNDDIILARELEARVALLVKAGAGSTTDETVQKIALDALIEEALVAQAARTVGLKVTEEEVTAAISQIMQTNGINDEQLGVALAEQGYTLATYRQSIHGELVRYRMIVYVVQPSIQITDQHVKEAYEHVKLTQGDGVGSLEDLKGPIRDQLYQEATINGTQQWLDQLRRESYIDLR